MNDKNYQIKNFYVVEGIDGSGKTTFCHGLKALIEKSGKNCIILNESDDPAYHDLIRSLLKADMASPVSESYTFAAARANCVDHMRTFMKNHPDSIVIFDRYIPSSLVYQTEKVPVEEVKHINAYFPIPEVIFYLKLPIEVALKRIEDRSEKTIEKFETKELLEKWNKKYDEVLLRRSSDLSYIEDDEVASPAIQGLEVVNLYHKPKDKPRIVTLDASKEPDEVLDEACNKYNIF